jgi:hypothetical protein
MWHDDQPAAYVADTVHLLRIENCSGADENISRHGFGEALDAAERLGRIERNFDDAEACLNQNMTDGFGVFGFQAPQDRHERKPS